MTSRKRWEHAIEHMLRNTPFYDEYLKEISAIAFLGIPSRKDLLKLSRTQRSIDSNPFLKSKITTAKASYTCTQDLWYDMHPSHSLSLILRRLLDRWALTTRDVVNRLSDLCHKDIVASSIVSNLARSAPFLNLSDQEAEDNRIESWEKEILATQMPEPLPCLDYSVWFSDDPDSIFQELSTKLPPSPQHNQRIKDTFKQWRQQLEGQTFFPQMQSNKSVSRRTAYEYSVATSRTNQEILDSRVSTSMLERHYAESGVEIGGCCELRQAWKYNDLTPRTYFAQGGTTFHASKYIRNVANSLCNAFPETNFLTRFSIHDLALDDDDTSFIYDYSSFTSRLAELKHFLEALATFCDSTEIFIVDSRQGVLRWSLGALIREYNQVCNTKTEFSIHRYLPGEVIPLEHQLAGLLGIYGNIVLSTTLHGLHACQLCGDKGGCRCVGDDVFAKVRLTAEWGKCEVIEAIQELGEVHPSKVRWWSFRDLEHDDEDDRAYPYIKRPLDRFYNRMIHSPALFLPIWGLIFPLPDGIHEIEDDIPFRYKTLGVQTLSTIKQAQALYPPLSGIQECLLQEYLRSLYRALGCQEDGLLPFESQVHKSGVRISNVFIPRISGEFLRIDPWDHIRHRFETRKEVMLQIPMHTKEKEVRFEELVRDGGPVISNRDKRISYLENLSWCKSNALFETRWMDFDEYRLFYEAFFRGDLYSLYECQLSSDCPRWITELL